MNSESYFESDRVEKKLRVGYLFEFYGQLLTEKQQDIMSMYVDEDLSLVEIGEALGATRQSIYDAIKRSKVHLEGYEEKLGLLEKLKVEGSKVDKALSMIAEVIESENTDSETREKLSKATKILEAVSFYRE